MSNLNEFAHLVMQSAQQQISEMRLLFFGHIANYDPKTHSAQVVIPTLRNANGVAILTPYLQLGTIWAGNNFGVQVAPYGGATPENPTQGEQCIVDCMFKKNNLMASSVMLFNVINQPPGADIRNYTELQSGECIIVQKSGSYIYFKENGSIILDVLQENSSDNTSGNIVLNAVNEIQINAQVKVTVTAPEVLIDSDTINAGSGTAISLINSNLVDIYNSHVHNESTGGTTLPVGKTYEIGQSEITQNLFGS